MYVLRSARVRQIVKWKECRVSYHSGAGVFGHRPRMADNTGTILPKTGYPGHLFGGFCGGATNT